MDVQLAQMMSALCCICTMLMWLLWKHLFCSLAVGWASVGILCSSLTSEKGVEVLWMVKCSYLQLTCLMQSVLWPLMLAYGAAFHTYLRMIQRGCRGLQEKESLLFFWSRGKKDWIKLIYFYATKTSVNLINEAWVRRTEIIISQAYKFLCFHSSKVG